MTITPSFFMPEEFDGNFFEEPVSRDELSEAARIAAELLPRGGWTGAQIDSAHSQKGRERGPR
jgi:hypothetical protein